MKSKYTKVELMHRHGSFFIHDCITGHTRPATRQEIICLFGEPVAQFVAETPGWIAYDSEDAARAALATDPALSSFQAAISILDDLPPAA